MTCRCRSASGSGKCFMRCFAMFSARSKVFKIQLKLNLIHKRQPPGEDINLEPSGCPEQPVASGMQRVETADVTNLKVIFHIDDNRVVDFPEKWPIKSCFSNDDEPNLPLAKGATPCSARSLPSGRCFTSRACSYYYSCRKKTKNGATFSIKI